MKEMGTNKINTRSVILYFTVNPVQNNNILNHRRFGDILSVILRGRVLITY